MSNTKSQANVMRRTMTGAQPVTQMSSIGAGVRESSESFMLDLRNECSATAKLEQLKAKYQRATSTNGNQRTRTRGF